MKGGPILNAVRFKNITIKQNNCTGAKVSGQQNFQPHNDVQYLSAEKQCPTTSSFVSNTGTDNFIT